MILHIFASSADESGSVAVTEDIGKKLSAGERAVLIVPDQYTLEAERYVVDRLGLRGFMDLEVYSLGGFGARVLERGGGRTLTPLDERGCAMLMTDIINRHKKELEYYSKAAGRRGFVPLLMQTVNALRASLTTYDDLLNASGNVHSAKLKDIALLYRLYSEAVKDKYTDTGEFLQQVAARLESSGAVKGSHVYFQGFETYSGQQYLLMEHILKSAQSLTVAIACPPESQDELYSPQKKAVKRLREIAQAAGAKVLQSDVTGMGPAKSPEIAHLKKYFLTDSVPVIYEKSAENIEIFYAQSLRPEVEMAAERVTAYVKAGLRYNKILVICNALEEYAPVIERVFGNYNIPYFVDYKRPVAGHPVIEALLGVLDVIAGGFERGDVIRLLKTGFAGATREEAEQFELFCIRYGVNGSELLKGIKRSRGGKGYDAEAPAMEQLRERVMQPVLQLKHRLADANGAQGATALYDYMRICGISGKLEELIQSQLQEGYTDEAARSSQMWNIACGMLDQLVAIFGQSPIDARGFSHILHAGFSEYKAGLIPTTADQVLIGDIHRTKTHQVEAVLILGVNEDILPAVGGFGGLISNAEAQRLRSGGVDLGMQAEDMDSAERFAVYSAFIKPGERLYISCASGGVKNETEPRRPSYLIDMLRQLFPQARVSTELGTKGFIPSAEIAAFERLIPRLREAVDGHDIGPKWRDVYRYFSSYPLWRKRLGHIKRAFSGRAVPSLSPDTAVLLYPKDNFSSISRLENFAACPFKHFAAYGLYPDIIKEFEVESSIAGSVIHEAVENYIAQLRNQDNWADLDKDSCEQLLADLVVKAAQKQEADRFLVNGTARFARRTLERIARGTAWALAQHISRGVFRPVSEEVSFGMAGGYEAFEIDLPEGKLKLRGRIDRVDKAEIGGKQYIRIIDYKTGSTQLDYTHAYNGLQLQLMLYMKAVLKAFDGALPAGMFYCTVQNTAIDAADVRGKNPADIAQELLKTTALDGVVVAEPEILSAMDKGTLTGESVAINYKLNKDGSVHSNRKAVKREVMENILNHAQQTAAQLAGGVISGRIEPLPYKADKDDNACRYCDYKSVCGFDPTAGDKYRELKKCSVEDYGGENDDQVDD